MQNENGIKTELNRWGKKLFFFFAQERYTYLVGTVGTAREWTEQKRSE